MHSLKKSFAALLLALPLAAIAGEASTVTSLSFTDISGKQHTVSNDSGTRAWVFLFVWHTCPVANAYAPEIERIYQDYRDRDVAFFLVHVDPGATRETIRQHTQDYRLSLPAVRDAGHALVNRCGATMTPEAVVIASNLEVVYRGRIDDRQAAYGKRRHEAAQKDLRNTLDVLLSGDIPKYRKTPVIGCYIPETE